MDEIGQKRKKKNLVPNSVYTQPRQENSEKNCKKIRKIKKLFPALFLAKTGRDSPGKREKSCSPEFRSYSSLARKFLKKKQKNEKTSLRHYF